MAELGFAPTEFTEPELALQAEVREFLAAELPKGSYEPGMGMGAHADKDFSMKLGARGWLGMAIPKQYGGSSRTPMDRFVVTEELLRWGAPVNHHWVADRQSAASINKFGTEEQKQRFLPGICRGEYAFSIGMSEPDSGSDLASLSTRATKVEGGWVVNGTKIWTTGAHRNDYMITLVRTGSDAEKHAGLSQLIVDLRGEGVEVRAIPFLDGTHDFNEVQFTDAFVADDLLLGQVGMGWAQNTAELAYERGGPDRWLSTFGVFETFLREFGDDLPDGAEARIGEITARYWGIRRMSIGVARMIESGGAPVVEAALVKELGTRFEQDITETLVGLLDIEPSPTSTSMFERLVSTAILTGPCFTIRGGTIEILRSVVSKGLRP